MIEKTTPYDLGVQAFAEFKSKFPMNDKYFRVEYLQGDYEVPEKFKFFDQWLDGYAAAEKQLFESLEKEFKNKKNKGSESEMFKVKKKKGEKGRSGSL